MGWRLSYYKCPKEHAEKYRNYTDEDIKNDEYPDSTLKDFKVYFREYTEILYERHSFDFDDLLLKTIDILEDKDNGVTRTVVNKSTQEIPYFTDGRSCFVKVGVSIQGVEYIEYFPIMGLKNDAIPANRVTMTDVNKALQRAFVKACARHGLGLYIYAGEDLPEVEKNAPVVVSDATDFKSVQTDVINLVTKMQNDPEVVRYIKEMFPGTRLSQTTEEHLDKLIAARTYLSSRQ